MNWSKVIEIFNREAAVIASRLEQVLVVDNKGQIISHVVSGEQRIVDLQTMQLCNIMAQALQSGLEEISKPDTNTYTACNNRIWNDAVNEAARLAETSKGYPTPVSQAILKLKK